MSDSKLSRRLFLRTLVGGTTAALLVPVSLFAAEARHKGRKHLADSVSGTAKANEPAVPPRILMIDPGHGGKDPGAVSGSGIYEKDVTLDISRRMHKILQSDTKIKPHLTRDKDEFIPLAQRVVRGQEAKADFFISIHADSAKETEARGFSAYSLSEEGTDDFARELAEQENLADRFGKLNIDQSDKDVANILFELANRETQNIAQRAKVKLVQGVGREWRLLNNPIRAANFAVLRAPEIPSILVETGFLSNKHDEELLRRPQQREKIAKLLARELSKFLTSA